MGRKELNPVDAYRKEQKKKELKKHQKDRQKSKEVNKLLDNPEKVEAEISRVQRESNHNKLDKGLHDKLRELKAMKVVADRRQAQKSLMSEALQPQSQVEKNQESANSHQLHAPPNYLSYLGSNSHYLRPPTASSGFAAFPPPPVPSLPYMSSASPYLNTTYPSTTYPLHPYAAVPTPRFDVPGDRRLGREIIDPLDPAAVGYANRFGSESHKRKHKVHEEAIPQDKLTHEVQAPPEIILRIEPPASVEVSSQQNQEISMPSPQIPQINIAEIMKRRRMLTSDTDDVGPALPSPAQEAGPKQTSSLPGMSYYSDSEPEDEDEEKKVEEKKAEEVKTEAIHYLSPMNDSSLISFSPQISAKPSITQQTPLVPPPKPVRIESDLVSFVPAALRVKRKPQTLSQSKISRNVQNLELPPSTLPAQDGSQYDFPEKRDSVDDAYEQFMSEINQLG